MIGCQIWLLRLVVKIVVKIAVKIVVITSPRVSSVSIFGIFTSLIYINTESNLLTISHISDDFTCVLAAPCRADRPHWAPSELSATALCYCALLVSAYSRL